MLVLMTDSQFIKLAWCNDHSLWTSKKFHLNFHHLSGNQPSPGMCQQLFDLKNHFWRGFISDSIFTVCVQSKTENCKQYVGVIESVNFFWHPVRRHFSSSTYTLSNSKAIYFPNKFHRFSYENNHNLLHTANNIQ